jgi:RNA polymerase sigma factor for flagellar operon FliA
VPEPSVASDPESLFLESLPAIDKVVGILGVRHGLSDVDVEEFGSWARARLIDGDYAVFRKFAGRSSLNTYLSVVLANLLKDFCNGRWGRWRPSAEAKRIGPLGIRFEAMVYRDGYAAREAVQVLRARGAADSELRTLAARIPVRAPAREVSLDAVADTAPAPEQADQRLRLAEDDAEQARIGQLVASALAELPPEDQVLVRMRFWDNFSVADIARALGQEQKPLYRKLEAIQRRLGAMLQAEGMDRDRVAALLAAEGTD